MSDYFIVYKPFQTASQFSSLADKKTLKDYFDVPRDVYPVGRLDYDSEGLLILSNDASLNHQLLHPGFAHVREYHVQVEGLIGSEAISRLETGINISIDGKPYHTKPCIASIIPETKSWPERNPPIRFRKNIPTSWISLALTEGKNRQVRKMTAAVGFPTLRLIRYSIEDVTIENMHAGEMKRMDKASLYKRLRLADKKRGPV